MTFSMVAPSALCTVMAKAGWTGNRWRRVTLDGWNPSPPYTGVYFFFCGRFLHSLSCSLATFAGQCTHKQLAGVRIHTSTTCCRWRRVWFWSSYRQKLPMQSHVGHLGLWMLYFHWEIQRHSKLICLFQIHVHRYHLSWSFQNSHHDGKCSKEYWMKWRPMCQECLQTKSG